MRKVLFAFLVSVLVLGSFMAVTADAADAPKKIVWKSSGHGPASDPSQIFHDELCKAITAA